ncbi:MAG: hypothetical protein AB1942_10120, partial [Pseudomonadota bacterium]
LAAAPVALRTLAPATLRAATITLGAITLLEALLAPGAVSTILRQGGARAGQEDDGQGRHGVLHLVVVRSDPFGSLVP